MSTNRCRGCSKTFNENTFRVNNHCDSCVTTCHCPFEKDTHYAFKTAPCSFCGARTCPKCLLIPPSDEYQCLSPLYICYKHRLLDSERIKAEKALLEGEEEEEEGPPRKLIREKRVLTTGGGDQLARFIESLPDPRD